ncbi:hypothetical protein E6W39_08820 [Kitasatospora acidiphila]|uniref:Uncharacterized protein n=1 Tax=Kitasatospora acidiphila TaxID=2567942 RepID=A0A540W043_9ACTN|nr:hypothetical protein [Kitasatospora acidiphila]TQF02360.1 hypothetical protein E6W39_08820 [Kitasatospora acidiphila]
MPEAVEHRDPGPRHQSRVRGAVLLVLGYVLLPPGSCSSSSGWSRFVYGLRPVYERLGVRRPGVTLRLPTHARPTRRQVPLFCAVFALPVVVLGLLVLQITGVVGG